MRHRKKQDFLTRFGGVLNLCTWIQTFRMQDSRVFREEKVLKSLRLV